MNIKTTVDPMVKAVGMFLKGALIIAVAALAVLSARFFYSVHGGTIKGLENKTAQVESQAMRIHNQAVMEKRACEAVVIKLRQMGNKRVDAVLDTHLGGAR